VRTNYSLILINLNYYITSENRHKRSDANEWWRN